MEMACSGVAVYLGYDDEIITEKHKGLVSYTTNKIGGRADLPNDVNLQNRTCPLCQLPRPLVLQLYAPLDTVYHRTLYIFACINPKCWNRNESWTCFRVQTLENLQPTIERPKSVGITDWCQGADSWDDDANANVNEENGNTIGNVERISDEDDESCSFDDSVRFDFEHLNVDDRNANTEEAQGGAVGRLRSPSATAEIEGEESEMISIDTPTVPQHDIVALFKEVAPLPQELCEKVETKLEPQFVSCFINVWEEVNNTSISDHHVRELLQEYQQNSEDNFMNVMESDDAAADNATLEKYEKSLPAHGDKMFHHLLSRIQMNPGQLLRYSRNSSPLLMYPLQNKPKKCLHCQEEMCFELQILPTLIPKLQLMTDPRTVTRLEFGNVLIFTCKRSCWSTDTDFRKETVIVQTEMY